MRILSRSLSTIGVDDWFHILGNPPESSIETTANLTFVDSTLLASEEAED